MLCLLWPGPIVGLRGGMERVTSAALMMANQTSLELGRQAACQRALGLLANS